MDFRKAAAISNFLSKDYAESIFKLLLAYQDISASEAASRLNLHIRTVQDFLETMATHEIIDREEVYEKKRPYNRYKLKKKKIEIVIDLDSAIESNLGSSTDYKIKESRNTKAKFSTARNGEYFSSVSIWDGKGRIAKERKINLTKAQGRFLYFLPFPDAIPQTIEEIMNSGDVDPQNKSEIVDIVEELRKMKVIQKVPG